MNTESCCEFTVSELQTDFLYLKNKCEEHKNNSLKRTEVSYRVNKVIAQFYFSVHSKITLKECQNNFS